MLFTAFFWNEKNRSSQPGVGFRRLNMPSGPSKAPGPHEIQGAVVRGAAEGPVPVGGEMVHLLVRTGTRARAAGGG